MNIRSSALPPVKHRLSKSPSDPGCCGTEITTRTSKMNKSRDSFMSIVLSSSNREASILCSVPSLWATHSRNIEIVYHVVYHNISRCSEQ